MKSNLSIVVIVMLIGIAMVISCANKQVNPLNTATSNQPSSATTEVSDKVISEQATTKQASPSDLATAFDPEMFFHKFCSSCHGQRMKTFVDRNWKYGSSLAEIEKSIAKGIVDEGMPAYEATMEPEEISLLSKYILQGIKDRKSYDIVEKQTPKNYVTNFYNLEVDTVVSGIEIPWGIKVHSDGTIFFTERKGKFKIKRPGQEIVEIKETPNARAYGQGGMMDVLLHPQYDTNGWIYLSFTKPNGLKHTTAVVRGKIVDNKFVEQQEIFEALPYVSTRYHFGSRMVFDNDGYLYVTVGDRGKRDDHPQFLTNGCGKVHRLFEDGRIPEDNPFYNEKDATQSIWSYGHRNQQGMIYDPINDKLWTNEHGPRGGDELNLVEKSVNYGWPVVSYGINYNGTTFTDKTEEDGIRHPVNVWIPSIAPSGMALVDNNYPLWSGDILSGSLRFHYISRIRVAGNEFVEEERILKDIGRVRAIEMGADGFLYIGIEDPGRILKVTITSDNMLDQR